MGQDLFQGSPRSKVDRLAAALRTLHKALIDATQRSYERDHGRVQSPYALFALVAHDPAFAWLQPMTRLIVELEDLVARNGPPLGPADATAARSKAEHLLLSQGEAFSESYRALVQNSPEIAAEHGRFQSVLKGLG